MQNKEIRDTQVAGACIDWKKKISIYEFEIKLGQWKKKVLKHFDTMFYKK